MLSIGTIVFPKFWKDILVFGWKRIITAIFSRKGLNHPWVWGQRTGYLLFGRMPDEAWRGEQFGFLEPRLLESRDSSSDMLYTWYWEGFPGFSSFFPPQSRDGQAPQMTILYAFYFVCLFYLFVFVRFLFCSFVFLFSFCFCSTLRTVFWCWGLCWGCRPLKQSFKMFILTFIFLKRTPL